jgi:hypothetical protein
MTAIIVKSYAHVNKALPNWDTPQGRIVKSKDHYDRLMKENNMVSYETMMQQAENKKLKPYILSKKAQAIINHASNVKDKKGRVKLSDSAIDAMKEIGAIGKSIPDYMKLPSAYQGKGGFNT